MLIEARIKNVARPELGELMLPLFGAAKYPVQFIDGLGPVKATISSTNYSDADEEYLQSSRVGSRNIILTLGLNPDYAVNEDPEALRRHLYKYVYPKGMVSMSFVTDSGNTFAISGVVESVEPPLFVREPAVQVSIICHRPWLESVTAKNYTLSKPNNSYIDVVNDGQVPAPFKLITTLGSAGSDVEISVRTSSRTDSLSVLGGFASGNVLTLTTAPRQKDILKGSNSILHELAVGSTWPTLPPGPSQLWIRVSGGSGSNTFNLTFNERMAGL